jgi:hypothetical protein
VKPSILALLVCAISGTSRLQADLASDPPQQIAKYLDGQGLGTGGWKRLDGSDYFASSPYKELPSTGVAKNNLAYYCEGSVTKVQRVYVTLNVNSPADAGAAQWALADTSAALCKAAIGKDLPDVIRGSLTKGLANKWQSGPYLIECKKDVWPTGRGYSLRFEIALSQ